MKTLNLSFLWHMHQPCYVDASTGKITLPWVRLHAIKAYYDMPLVLEEFPAVRSTFNVVPSLIEQINMYTKEKVTDTFQDYTMKPAAELSPEDRIFILRHFFTCHWGTMVEPHRHYHSLLLKRGTSNNKESLEKNLKRFKTQDFLDIQCWFNLAWLGFKAIERKEGLRELISKGKNFTEEDKKYIINMHTEILSELLDIYKRMQDKGQIEVSLSPYFHPILPLVIDTDAAKAAMPEAILPLRAQFPEDAEAQIKKGIETYRQTFGKNPFGMWPSEGSVSEKALELIRKNEIYWVATDEEILENSVGKLKDRDEIFRPYLYNTPFGDINMFFRDKNLSNLISFTYNKLSSNESAANFMDHLSKILESTRMTDPTVTIVLDGENPWEYYQDKGEGFLRSLYKTLSESQSVKTRTFSDIAWSVNEKGKLSKVFPGSWINHNFDIWIGKTNTNKAWELLKRTRDILTSALSRQDLPQETREKAWKELYAAEGSDWFWWLSDYFYNDNALEFDRLFRNHLVKIYELLGMGVPWHLQVPLCTPKAYVPPSKPKGLMSPVLDGTVTNFYEWANSGLFEIVKLGSFMFEGEKFLKSIHYGFDLENFYLRLDPNWTKKDNALWDKSIEIDIVTEKYFRINLSPRSETKSFTLLESQDRLAYEPAGQFPSIGIGDIIEIALPFTSIGVNQGQTVMFSVSIKHEGMELKRYPRGDYLSFEAPTPDFDQTQWMV